MNLEVTYKTKQSHYGMAGFSIIELLVVIVISSILLSVAVPSFRDLMLQTTTSRITNELLGDLKYARSEAIRRSTLVEVIVASGTASTDWKNGWKVVADTDRDAAFSNAEKAAPLRVHAAAPSGYTVTASCVSCADVTQTVFNSAGGMPVTTALPTMTWAFAICRPDKVLAKGNTVNVVSSGQSTSSKGAGACA